MKKTPETIFIKPIASDELRRHPERLLRDDTPAAKAAHIIATQYGEAMKNLAEK